MIKWNDEYQVYVSDDGRVISKTTGECSLEKLTNGYLRWSTYRNKKKVRVLVHRLVWETFNHKIPDNMEIDHINKQRDDNNLSNLRCVTHLENMKNWSVNERHPRTEFGMKFKEHFNIQMSKNKSLYTREHAYYKKNGKCSWE